MQQNNEQKIPQCFVCHITFNDFKSLARHIVENRSSHGKSYFWAAKVLTDIERLNKKQDLSGRMPLTEEQREAKRSMERTLSGIEKSAMTVCPNCHANFPQRLPIEFVESDTAWKQKGKLVVMCLNCRR